MASAKFIILRDNRAKAKRLFKMKGPAANTVRKQWAVIYLSYARRRFVKLSRGGGGWAPLAPSTVAGRRKGKGKGTPQILVDNGTLLNALGVGASGNLIKPLPQGVRVGYGGAASHPKAGMTIAALAKIHQNGDPARSLPARPIIVPPDNATSLRLGSALQAQIRKTLT